MKSVFFRMFIAAMALLGSGHVLAKLPPLVEPVVKFDDGQVMTARQMHDYIIAGADRYTEKVVSKLESDANGEIRLVLTQANRHIFRVAIPYDENGFQVKYLSSSPGLRYQLSGEERLIHPNYMKWINGLVMEIKMARQLGLDARGEPTNPKLASYMTFVGPSSAGFAVSYAEDAYEAPPWSGYMPAKALKIYGYSFIAMHNMTISCGPICLEFEPTGGRSYEARWEEEGTAGRDGICMLSVHDVSDGGNRRIGSSRTSCPAAKSWFQRLLD